MQVKEKYYVSKYRDVWVDGEWEVEKCKEERTRYVEVAADWKSLIILDMTRYDDSWDNVVSCTLTEEELCKKFDDGYGSHEGKPFTLWTKTRVYFPLVYDGAEWVGSVSREPDGIPTTHFGGG